MNHQCMIVDGIPTGVSIPDYAYNEDLQSPYYLGENHRAYPGLIRTFSPEE